MAVTEYRCRRTLLAPLGNEDRPTAHRVGDDLALKAEPGQRWGDLVGEIAFQHRQALLDLAFGRDRDAAREIGDEPAVVEIALSGGNGGGAGHATSRNGQSGDQTLGYDKHASARGGNDAGLVADRRRWRGRA